MQTTSPDSRLPGKPAGFVLRACAWCIDAAIVLPLVCLATYLCTDPAAIWQAFLSLHRQVSMQAAMAAFDGLDFISFVQSLLSDADIQADARQLATRLLHMTFVFIAGFALASGLLNVWGETRAACGSIGKRHVGLAVVDAGSGQGLSVSRSVLRQLAASLSWLSLNLGHLMAALPPDHTTLHDRLTRTRVIIRVPSSRN